MATAFPRAVVWDSSVDHHLTVLVERHKLRVIVACQECDRAYELMLRDLEWAKQTVLRDDKAQVVAWVERDE